MFSDVTFNEVHGFIKQYLMREQNQKKCYGCLGQPLSQQIENMFSPIRVPETPYIVRSLSVDVERRIFIGRHQTEPAWMLDFLPDGGDMRVE